MSVPTWLKKRRKAARSEKRRWAERRKRWAKQDAISHLSQARDKAGRFVAAMVILGAVIVLLLTAKYMQ